MQVDGLQSTRPDRVPGANPGRSGEAMFDMLTYEKGASVLRMLEQYLAPRCFATGSARTCGRTYGNAETTDLWDALEEATGQPVRADGLLDLPGRLPAHHGASADGAAAVLSQRIFRYLQDGRCARAHYHVPVFLRAGTNSGVASKTVAPDGRAATRSLAGQTASGSVVNAGGHGFYRVRYTQRNFRRAQGKLSRQALGMERFGLLNDSWATTLASLIR